MKSFLFLLLNVYAPSVFLRSFSSALTRLDKLKNYNINWMAGRTHSGKRNRVTYNTNKTSPRIVNMVTKKFWSLRKLKGFYNISVLFQSMVMLLNHLAAQFSNEGFWDGLT